MDEPIDGDPIDMPDTADEAALQRVKAVARLMDEAIEIPGTGFKVGLDPVLSVVPGAGDLLSGAVSLYIVAEAAYLGVPLKTVVKMLANVGVDVAVGSVPVIGTVFDAFWKTNKWNVEHIEEFLQAEAHGGLHGGDDGPVTIDVTDTE